MPTGTLTGYADAAAVVAALDSIGTAPAPRATATITSGALATPLDGKAYSVQLSSDVSAWTAALPSGGDASTHLHSALVDFLPPDSGGPFTAAIPVSWANLGPLTSIALSSTSEPIRASLSTMADGTVVLSAAQVMA
jgi:hypothetical protein